MGQIKKLDKLPPKKEKVMTVAILKQLAESANALGKSKFWFEKYCNNLPRGIAVNVKD